MAETPVLDARVETATDTPPSRNLSGWLPRPWLFPLLAFVGAWILIIVAWLVASKAYSHQMYWFNYFGYKDGRWYGRIAEHGYPPAGVAPKAAAAEAFYPLYPLAIALVMFLLGGHVAMAGLITQILTGAASAVAVWALADHVFGRRAADRAALLYCAFPGAMVLGMMYSEPLGIALTASCLLATLQRKWVLAGLLALLAGAEHSTMIVLLPVLGLVALHAIWTRRDWRSLIAPVLAPLGMLAYFAWGAYRYHDFLFWFRVERGIWHEHVDFGVHTFKALTWSLPDDSQYPLFYGLILALFLYAVVGIGLLIASRAPWPLTLYTVLALVSFSVTHVGIRPRFVLTTIGIFLGLGARLPRWVFWPLLAVSAGALAFYTGFWPYHVTGFPNP